MSGHVIAVVNPGSGRARPETVIGALRNLPTPVEVISPTEGDDIVALIRSHLDAGDFETVLACGGDGTVSAAASALRGREDRVRLGILPTGTANLLAADLGIPIDIDEACAVVAAGESRRIDTMDFEGRTCLCRIGVGAMAEVGKETNPIAKKALHGLAYAWRAVPVGLGAQIQGFELDIDGTVSQIDASSVIISNVSKVGLGNLVWGDRVRPDDGALDVFVIQGETLSERLSILWDALEKGASEAELISHARASRWAEIRTPAPTSGVADGETCLQERYRVELRPGSLEVLVPAVNTSRE